MDNLIAEGKAEPFIIVMTYGMTNDFQFGGGRRGRGAAPGGGAARGDTPAGAAAPAGGAPANAADNPPARGGRGGRGGPGGPGGFNFSAFERVLIDELIPYIDANFRTLADQPHR